MARRMGWHALAIVAITVALTLAVMPAAANSDVSWYHDWVAAAATYGYRDLAAHSSFNYLFGFKAVIWLFTEFRAALGAVFPIVSYSFVVGWRWFITIVSLGLGLELVWRLRSFVPARQLVGLAWIWCLLPFFFWMTTVWGQTDMLVLAPWLIGLTYLADRRYGLWAAWSLVAVVMKPTGFFLVPLILFLALVRLWQGSRFAAALTHWRVLVIFLAGVIMAALPFVIQFIVSAMDATYQTALTYNAFNYWFLVRPTTVTMQTTVNGLSYQAWSVIVVAIGEVLAAAWYLRLAAGNPSPAAWLRRALEYGATYMFVIVYFLTGIHERYWDFILAPLLVAAFMDRRWAWLFGALAIVATLNVVTVFPSSFTLFSILLRHWIEIGTALAIVAAMCGLWLIGLLAWEVRFANGSTDTKTR